MMGHGSSGVSDVRGQTLKWTWVIRGAWCKRTDLVRGMGHQGCLVR